VLPSHVCRSCENQAKVGSVMSQRTRYFCFHRRDVGTTSRACLDNWWIHRCSQESPTSNSP
ncbi:hypothetical protein CBR58_32095, partial [Bacillus thuringiensis]